MLYKNKEHFICEFEEIVRNLYSLDGEVTDTLLAVLLPEYSTPDERQQLDETKAVRNCRPIEGK